MDHILGNKRMQELTGATIVIHELEAYALTHQSPEMLSMFGAEPSPPAGRTVKDGDVITVGEVSLSVIHTPGHSPGGICLYSKGVVFTGDTLFVGSRRQNRRGRRLLGDACLLHSQQAVYPT